MKRATAGLGLAILAAAVGGCATDGAAPPEPIIKPVEVKVPVPVRCNPQLGPEPAYPDTDEALAAARDVFEGVKLLLAGRELRIARDAEKTAALKGCAGEVG